MTAIRAHQTFACAARGLEARALCALRTSTTERADVGCCGATGEGAAGGHAAVADPGVPAALRRAGGHRRRGPADRRR
ncbi:hypothetical protein DXX98_07865, partial [Janibacter melonis]|nr:hypothetical protein [Janibacter melonis]